MNLIYRPLRKIDLKILAVISTILNMYTPHRKNQFSLHSLSGIHINSSNLSKVGIKSFAGRDTHFSKQNFPPTKGQARNICQSHYPKIISGFCHTSL